MLELSSYKSDSEGQANERIRKTNEARKDNRKDHLDPLAHKTNEAGEMIIWKIVLIPWLERLTKSGRG